MVLPKFHASEKEDAINLLSTVVVKTPQATFNCVVGTMPDPSWVGVALPKNTIWVDGLQLEEGDTATEFTMD